MTGRHRLPTAVRLGLAAVLLGLLAAPSHGQNFCTDTTDAQEFFATPGVSMSITVDDGKDDTVETVAHCARRCRLSTECLSFTYSNKTCLLHPHDSTTGPEFKHAASNTLYYEKVDKEIDRTDYFGNCVTKYKNACQNGGSCKTDCSAKGYYCACPENYRGQSCEFAREDEPVLVQTIESPGPRGVAAFTFNNEHLLVIGAFQSTDADGNFIEATSRVFKFNETAGQYEYDHDLAEVSQVRGVTAMDVGDQMFLFAANFQDFGASRITDSVVYVYGNGTFQVHQTMTTYGAYKGAFLTSTTGQRYLFIGNYKGDSFNVNSPIYKWYSQYNRFYFVQNIATKGAAKSVLFDIAGVSYLVISFGRGDSVDYNTQPELWKRSETGFIYMGCYLDSSNPRAMESQYSSDTNDLETCTTHCRLRGYPYAGMQNSNQCFCSDEGYDIHGIRSDGECSSTCSGNGGQYCGGSYRNSVYMTEPQWTKIQTLPDVLSTVTSEHFHHEGADYLILAQHRDSTSCSEELLVYIWNGETEEFETHQRMSDTQCVHELAVFKANGRVFLITAATRRTVGSDLQDSDYTVDNIFYVLEGAIFVPYWSLEGRTTCDWEVVRRDGEIYLIQADYRNTDDGDFLDKAEVKIYQWY